MNDKINKTSICSIVFLDIIDYSKKSVSEQIDIKNQFNHLINHSLKDIEQEDRIILDTGDGAAIAHMGSPEDALFISLSIRDEILKNNILSPMPLYVRFGINLGPVRVVRDINGQPNIIGDGINVAQRIMSFAKPNQILVSRSYYEVTSRLTQEISQMFDYSGVKHDKHVREHEIYAVRLMKDAANTATNFIPLLRIAKPAKQLLNPFNWFNVINWKYVALSIPALMTLVIVIKSAATPSEPIITLEQTVSAKPATFTTTKVLKTEPLNDAQLLPNETLETDFVNTTDEKPLKTENRHNLHLQKNQLRSEKSVDKASVQAAIDTKPTERKNSKKSDKQALGELPAEFTHSNSETSQHAKSTTKSAELTPKTTPVQSEKISQKYGWQNFTDSLKQGHKAGCTQAEVSMNQCN